MPERVDGIGLGRLGSIKAVVTIDFCLMGHQTIEMILDRLLLELTAEESRFALKMEAFLPLNGWNRSDVSKAIYSFPFWSKDPGDEQPDVRMIIYKGDSDEWGWKVKFGTEIVHSDYGYRLGFAALFDAVESYILTGGQGWPK